MTNSTAATVHAALTLRYNAADGAQEFMANGLHVVLVHQGVNLHRPSTYLSVEYTDGQNRYVHEVGISGTADQVEMAIAAATRETGYVPAAREAELRVTR